MHKMYMSITLFVNTHIKFYITCETITKKYPEDKLVNYIQILYSRG